MGASFLVVRLPIRADISNLLPPTAQSVRDLKALEKRARAFGFIFVQVESDDPGVRSEAAEELYQRFRKIDAELLSNITFTSTAKQRFAWNNRFLFVELEDLEDARDAIEDMTQATKLSFLHPGSAQSRGSLEPWSSV